MTAHANIGINEAYLLAALCAVLLLIWIMRQASAMPLLCRLKTAVPATALAIAILGKAYIRFHGGDPAQWIDVARELCLCLFLLASIEFRRSRLGHY